MAVNNSSNIRQIDTDSGSAIVTAAVPNWNIVGGTNVTTSASGNTITINASGTSVLVQQARTQTATAASTGTSLGITSTPTTANTAFLMSLSITPTNSNNILEFDFCAPYSFSNTGSVSFFLFEGTTLRSSFIYNIEDTGRPNTAVFKYYRTAGTTSATTFNIYWAIAGGVGTARTLQNNVGTALYNTNVVTSFIITEIAI